MVLVAAAIISGAAAQRSKQVTVAAASDMSFALKEIAAKYEKQSGVQVRLIFGSSGNLYQQIRNGSPVDLFLSADEELPARLVQEGLAEKASLRQYAIGSLVIWVTADSKFDVERVAERVLVDPDAKRIAIANPQHAPYGRAAEAALRSWKLWDSIRPKLVLGENVAQAAQFVQSGNADVALLPLSLALSDQMKGGKYWRVPGSLHPPIQQALVVVNGRNQAEARSLAKFLFSPPALETLSRYGFKLPATKAATRK